MINRLAAAHRGTLRALQVIIHQLSDLSHSKVPPHYKQLGQLIRQLSLCSAKVEVDHGSAVPETALNILQKLEVKSIKYNQKAFAQCYMCFPQACLYVALKALLIIYTLALFPSLRKI